MHGHRAYRSADSAPAVTGPGLQASPNPARPLEVGDRRKPPGLITPDIQLIEWYWKAGNPAPRPVTKRTGCLVATTLRRAADRGTREDEWRRSSLLGGRAHHPQVATPTDLDPLADWLSTR